MAVRRTPIRIAACRECGKEFDSLRSDAVFCSAKCKADFNNRRIKRGGEFYDVVMEMRFDREKAAATKAWSLLCSIAGKFRQEDIDERDGRKSWSSTTRMNSVNSRMGR